MEKQGLKNVGRNTMNKFQFERLGVIHELLNPRGAKFTGEEMLNELNKRLLNKDIPPISKRTLILDIHYLRSKGAPIPEKHRHYYYDTSQPAFSFLNALGNSDLVLFNELKGIVAVLSQASGSVLETFTEALTSIKLDEFSQKLKQSTNKTILFELAQNLEDYQKEYLEQFVKFINDKQVVEITYKDYNDKYFEDIFHPYLLKQFNNRWYIFGFSETTYQGGNKKIYRYPIDDRLMKVVPTKSKMGGYQENDWWNAEQFFADMIGISKFDDSKVEIIKVRLYNKARLLLDSNPIHHTQELIEEEIESNSAIFQFELIINEEFKSKLWAYGADVEILHPQTLRDAFKQTAKMAAKRYE